ncbi:MAG: hypothetical protein SOW79_05015 [Prevotella sp.]|nr:hypothetical protein [Prevotella sp.]
MDRGRVVMEMTLHNVFVKPDEQRLSLLRLCHGEKRSDENQQSTDITDIQTQDDISPIGTRRYPDTGMTSPP